MNNNFIIFGGSTLILFISYFLYQIFKPFNRFTGDFPFIVDPVINQSLIQFINTRPSRHVYILTGPYQTGKRRSLDLIIEQLNKKNKFIINIDVSEALTPSDVYGFIKFDLLRLSSSHPEVGKLPNITIPSDFFKELDNIKCDAVIIRGVQKMRQLTPDLLDMAISYLSRRDLYGSDVPVIAETSDTSFKTRQLPPCFRVLSTSSIPQAKFNFVEKYHAFSSREFKQVSKLFGEHGGSLVSVFNYLKSGLSFQSAIQETANQLEYDLNSIKNSTSLNLKRICSSGEIHASHRIVEDAIELIRPGYYSITKDMILQPASPTVRKIVCAK